MRAATATPAKSFLTLQHFQAGCVAGRSLIILAPSTPCIRGGAPGYTFTPCRGVTVNHSILFTL